MPDRYVRRGGDDYAAALAALFPMGAAWPRDADSDLSRLISGIAQIWGEQVAQRADDLLVRETDPRSTLEMLDDWERAFGLPEPCTAEPLTIGDRQRALVLKMTTLGGQSREFFIGVASSIGYTITIEEYAPFMFGVSEFGDTRASTSEGDYYRWTMGSPEMRFYWTVHVGAVRLTWFRFGDGGGQCGIDPHLQIALATDLECLLRRWKPAHTEIIFDYSGVGGISDPMAGTP